jgi:hypothetical protein
MDAIGNSWYNDVYVGAPNCTRKNGYTLGTMGVLLRNATAVVIELLSNLTA